MSKAKPNQPPTSPIETDLPEGWALATIADITVPKVDQLGPGEAKEFTYIDIASIDNEQKSIITPRTLSYQEAPSRARQVVHSGDVLVSMTRPNLNAVALVGHELDGAIASTGFDVLRSVETLPGWLFLVVRSEAFVESMASLVQGALYPAVRPRDVRSFALPIPPLSEQKRIVAKVEALLESVNAARARLAKLPTILKRFRQSVLAAACSGQLTAEWRDEHPEASDASRIVAVLGRAHELVGGHKRGNAAEPTEEAHDLDPETLPATWKLTDLRTAVCPDRPITYGILKPGPDTPNGIPYVRVADFPDDRLNLNKIRRTSKDIERQYARARLRQGDILLSIRGTVGRVCIVPPELENANITQDTARLSIQDALDRDYVAWFLRAKTTQDRMRRAMKGVAVHGINIGDVRAIQLPVPPLDEQREIVRRVEALFALADEIEAHVRAATMRAERLPQAILARAFRGDLVPTEADLATEEGRDYEPAELLLARIREDRAQQKAQKQARPQTQTRKKVFMKKLEKAGVLEIIEAMPQDSFTFKELRAKVSGDYNALKDILFALLDDSESGIVQVFDKQAKTMRFQRRAKP